MTALGEAAVKTWEARGAMSLQNAQFGQDEWGGANGGDVSGGGELTHELADALVGAQVRGSGEPSGEHDVVVVREVDLVEHGVAGHGNLLGGDHIARVHD